LQSVVVRGVQASVSYTWSHSIDISSTDAFSNYLSTPSSVANPNVDHGNSDLDIRHAFTAGITYDVPSPESNKIAHAALGGWSEDFSLDRNGQRIIKIWWPGGS
jgi:hypothetical protein